MRALAFIKGETTKQTEVGKDNWARQRGFFPDRSGYRKAAEERDHCEDLALRIASFWKKAAIFLVTTTVLSFSFGLYAISRSEVVTRFVLVDKRSGDAEEVETNGDVTVPTVMMAREMRWIGKCVFGQSFDRNDRNECDRYRDETLVGNALETSDAWRGEADKRGKLRIATILSRKQNKSDMSWDVRYKVSEYDGPRLIQTAVWDTRIGFEYREPKLGLLFGQESGLFVHTLIPDKEGGV